MSRIDRITIQTYRYTLDNLGSSRSGRKPELTRFIVTIDADDGLSGSYAPHFGGTAHAQAQVQEMARGLIGLDPEQRERIFERLKLSHRHYDKSGIAALDTALWDLAGKKYGVPIARLLGGFRDRLPVYASTTSGQREAGGLDSVDSYADFAESCQAAGIPAFKIHSFFDGNPKTEIAIMSAVRRGVGDDMKLMNDPAGGTDIMHIDPELDGGITGTMKLAHFCDAIGMEVQLHMAGPMHRHCMAAIANTHFYELGLVRPDSPTNSLQPPIYADDYGDELGNVGQDGCVPVPTGPGLGVTYDVDRINSGEVGRVEIR